MITLVIMKKRSQTRSKGRVSNTSRRLHQYTATRLDRYHSSLQRDYDTYAGFSPALIQEAKKIRRENIRRELPQKSKMGFTKSFHSPIMVTTDLNRARLCRARQVRKEVLHAIGRSGSGNARPRYSPESRVKCR
ncbi:MAG: hypothetical protein [Microvirus sp.]|nr:MAG: hypothetical protein [Microvirus sp.]